MIDDGTLLRQFVKERSQTAFEEIVRRYVNLVFSVSVRALGGDAHRANDVSQRVFTDLARKASALCDRPSLAGWLHRSARLSAAEMIRAEVRRQKREEASVDLDDRTSEAPWEDLRPALDSVIDELKPEDREALILRFFGKQSFAQIGAMIRSSEDVAQKRVSRALSKLRSKLATRGITSSSVALATLLEAHAVVTAPVALTPAILATTAAGIAAAGASTVVPFVTMNMIKVGACAAVTLAGIGGITWQYQANRHLSERVSELTRQVERLPTLQSENERLRLGEDEAQAEMARLRSDVVRLNERTGNTSDGKDMAYGGNAQMNAGDKAIADRSTPSATALLVRSSIDGGDPHALLPALAISPQGQVMAHDAYYKLSSQDRARYASPEAMMAELLCATNPSTPSQLLMREELAGAHGMGPGLANDPRYKTIHSRTQEPSGRIRDSFQVFQQNPDGWRWVVSEGLVMKRLAEAGLITPPVKQGLGK